MLNELNADESNNALSYSARHAMTKNHINSLESAHDVATTIDRLESILTEKGLSVFGRVDHAANADSVGMTMHPTLLLIFGNPQVGTKLIMSTPHIALDLPLKMLAMEDKTGKVTLNWTDPHYLKSSHEVENCDELFVNITNILDGFARQAVSP